MSVKMILLHPYVRIDRKTVYKEHPNGIEGRLGSRVVLRRIASMLLDHIRRPRVRSPFQTAFCAFPTYLRSTFIDIGYVVCNSGSEADGATCQDSKHRFGSQVYRKMLPFRHPKILDLLDDLS